MSSLGQLLLPSLHAALASSISFVVPPQTPTTDNQEGDDALDDDAVWGRDPPTPTSPASHPTAASTTQLSGSTGEDDTEQQRRQSYVASLSPLERLRFLLWHQCIERVTIGLKEDAASGAMRQKLFDWCEHGSLPAQRRVDTQRRVNEAVADKQPLRPNPKECGDNGSNDNMCTAHDSAVEGRRRLSVVKTCAKSLVLLLCEVASPAHIVEGCDYILTELDAHVLDQSDAAVIEKAEAAMVAALTAYVRRYWAALLIPAATERSACRGDVGTSDEAAALQHIVDCARRAALQYLDRHGYHSDFIMSSVEHMAPSSSSTILLDKQALMVHTVGKLVMLRQSLATSMVRPSAVANGDDRRDAQTDTTSEAVVGAFDVAGALHQPLVTDAMVHLMTHRPNNAPNDCVRSIGIPGDVALRLHPLRHCRGGSTSSRPSPFVGAPTSAVALVSVGSRCVLLGPSSRLGMHGDLHDGDRAAESGKRAGETMRLPFPMVFGCGWPTATAAEHHRTPTTATTTDASSVSGYSDACVLRGLKSYALEHAHHLPYLAATCGSTLDLYDLAESVPARGDDFLADPPAMMRDVARRSPSDGGLQHCPLAPFAMRVTDTSGLSIRSVSGLGYGVAAVGPVVRILNVRDALDAATNAAAAAAEAADAIEEGTTEAAPQPVVLHGPSSLPLSRARGANPPASEPSLLLRFQPRTTLSARYVLSECVTAAAMCGYGASSLVTGRGDEVSVWDLACGAEVAVVGVNGWVQTQQGRSTTSGDQSLPEAFVTALHTSFEEHTVAVGTSGGLVALWDVRCKGGAPYRMFRAVPERCGAYRGSCAIRQLRFGGLGVRSIFASVPSDAAGAQLRLFRTGYERHPVWQSPDAADCTVARFDVGVVGATERPFLHMLTSEGYVLGGDVDYLAG